MTSSYVDVAQRNKYLLWKKGLERDHSMHEMMRWEVQLVTGDCKAMNNSPIVSEGNKS